MSSCLPLLLFSRATRLHVFAFFKSCLVFSLRKGINIVIGTPQRILDHILRTASLDLSHLQWLVIDEADRLLEMGFERDVRRIIEHIKKLNSANEKISENCERLRTVLLSATLTSGILTAVVVSLRLFGFTQLAVHLNLVRCYL